jgi:hypothetical protein
MGQKAPEPRETDPTSPDTLGDFDPVELIARALEDSCAAEATGERGLTERGEDMFAANRTKIEGI